jgi:myo-inositol 2-dehydrogenase / D-chiro-inositol 1-dehydrogenase
MSTSLRAGLTSVGLIGAGWIGAFHGESLARRVPGARLVMIADPAPGAAARPDWKDRGLLDTSIVTIRFDNGAMATAEASFQAAYGYDIRGEVFGSAGMVTAGDIRRGSLACYGEAGLTSATWRRNIDLFHDAYVAELTDFVTCVRDKTAPRVTGHDARAALAIALAAIRSVQARAPVRLADNESAAAAV